MQDIRTLRQEGETASEAFGRAGLLAAAPDEPTPEAGGTLQQLKNTQARPVVGARLVDTVHTL